MYNFFSTTAKNFQDFIAKFPNPKLIPKFPRPWEKSQAVGALQATVQQVANTAIQWCRSLITARSITALVSQWSESHLWK
jgi:hypothetical protein